MQNIKQNKKGIAAILSVIILGSITLLIAISVSLIGIDESKTALDQRKAAEVLAGAESCVEVALLELQSDKNYAGATIISGNVSCTSTVTGVGSLIEVDASLDSKYYTSLSVDVDNSSAPVYTVTSWEEQ